MSWAADEINMRFTNQHPTCKSVYGVQINIQSINQLPGYKSTPEAQFIIRGVQTIIQVTNHHSWYKSRSGVHTNMRCTNQHPGYKSISGVQINTRCLKSTCDSQINIRGTNHYYYYNIRGHGLSLPTDNGDNGKHDCWKHLSFTPQTCRTSILPV